MKVDYLDINKIIIYGNYFSISHYFYYGFLSLSGNKFITTDIKYERNTDTE